MRELPSLLGESDVVKSLLYLPGVSTAGEGSGGFNVRGGNIDQNLVMQDGMPLFNASHALGFFSVFNADAVESVTLYKGHIPAQYGGRLSSVLDVGLKDGNRFGWHGNGSVGIISSKAVLEGPIIKDKLSILVGGRASYIGYILPQVRNRSVARSAARFNDQLAKITWRLSPKATFRAKPATRRQPRPHPQQPFFYGGLRFRRPLQSFSVRPQGQRCLFAPKRH
jgi:hypothetical protein